MVEDRDPALQEKKRGQMSVSEAGKKFCSCCGHHLWKYKGRWYLWYNGKNVRHARYVVGFRDPGQDSGQHVHHQNEDSMDDARMNLEALAASAHLRGHSMGRQLSSETRAKIAVSLKGKIPINKNQQTITCEVCGKQRFVPPSERAQRFCSRKCKAQSQHKSFCVQGHILDEVNTYVSPDGRRQCKTCLRERNRQWCKNHERGSKNDKQQ